MAGSVNGANGKRLSASSSPAVARQYAKNYAKGLKTYKANRKAGKPMKNATVVAPAQSMKIATVNKTPVVNAGARGLSDVQKQYLSRPTRMGRTKGELATKMLRSYARNPLKKAPSYRELLKPSGSDSARDVMIRAITRKAMEREKKAVKARIKSGASKRTEGKQWKDMLGVSLVQAMTKNVKIV